MEIIAIGIVDRGEVVVQVGEASCVRCGAPFKIGQHVCADRVLDLDETELSVLLDKEYAYEWER